MHPLLERIYTEGVIRGPEGIDVRVTSHVPRDEAELLYDVVERVGSGDVVEVGMAFGISSLALADALEKRGTEGTLVAMDPAQHDEVWRGLGLAQIQAAGLSHRIEFHERASQVVMPELWRSSRRFTVAFIDGWHTFDHTLIDCFYADRMLEVGGYLVLDDVGYPAIRRAVQFVLSNWAYELSDALYGEGELRHHRVRRTIKRWLAGIARTDQTPSLEHRVLFQQLVGTHAVALRKLKDDGRRFDHFVPF